MHVCKNMISSDAFLHERANTEREKKKHNNYNETKRNEKVLYRSPCTHAINQYHISSPNGINSKVFCCRKFPKHVDVVLFFCTMLRYKRILHKSMMLKKRNTTMTKRKKKQQQQLILWLLHHSYCSIGRGSNVMWMDEQLIVEQSRFKGIILVERQDEYLSDAFALCTPKTQRTKREIEEKAAKSHRKVLLSRETRNVDGI